VITSSWSTCDSTQHGIHPIFFETFRCFASDLRRQRDSGIIESFSTNNVRQLIDKALQAVHKGVYAIAAAAMASAPVIL